MPITEIAQIRLKNTAEPPTAVIKERLRAAQEGQTEYSKHPVTFLKQVEDPSFTYLVGGWDSVETHTVEWIASETNQRLLGALRDDIGVEWVFHLDIDPAAAREPLDAPVVAVSWFFVEPSQKAEFEATYNAGKSHLDAYIAPFKQAGGWRIDKQGEEEEFVLFSGWNSVEHHHSFAATEGFKEFGKVKNFMKRADVKHAQLEKFQ